MDDEALPKPISDLLKKIATKAKKSDKHTIELANHLRDLRKLVEAGIVGKVDWYVWAGENVKVRKSKLRALMRIAEAADQRAEAAHQRELNARRQARYRAKQPMLSQLAPANREIVEWAKTAPVPEAKAILRVIYTRSNLQNVSP